MNDIFDVASYFCLHELTSECEPFRLRRSLDLNLTPNDLTNSILAQNSTLSQTTDSEEFFSECPTDQSDLAQINVLDMIQSGVQPGPDFAQTETQNENQTTQNYEVIAQNSHTPIPPSRYPSSPRPEVVDWTGSEQVKIDDIVPTLTTTGCGQELIQTESSHQVCPICAKHFVSASELERHQTLNHPKTSRETNKFQCAECGKLLSTRRTLNQHSRAHATNNLPKTETVNKRKKCQYCDKDFSTKGFKIEIG